MIGVAVVTGATGLIGRHLVERLLARGTTVRALVRAPDRLGLRPPGLEVVAGGLDTPALTRALDGAEVVFHLAACARAWSRDPDEFTEVNVRAVDRLLRAARAADVRRVIHVSTVLTFPPFRAGTTSIPYVETKRRGEALVAEYAAAGGGAVVVHPTRVYGPGPLNDANGVTRLVAQCLAGPVVFRLDDGGVQANYVHAADVAAGMMLAAERGVSGAHYVLGGENSSLGDLLRLTAQLAHVKPRIVPLPRPAALTAAHASMLWARLGGTALITPAWVLSYFDDQRVDVSDTCRALGYRYRPLAVGLEETILWLRRNLTAGS
jgi:nucleoside-diphosphate-sugar epimerase